MGLETSPSLSVLEIVVQNLKPTLLAVIVPFVLMVLFTVLRYSLGNSVTAMPDVLVFVCTIDFVFALDAKPWMPMLRPTVREIFTGVAFTFAILGLLHYIFALRVERRIMRYWFRRSYPHMIASRYPDILHARFPYGGILVSWILIVGLIGLNLAVFFGHTIWNF